MFNRRITWRFAAVALSTGILAFGAFAEEPPLPDLPAFPGPGTSVPEATSGSLVPVIAKVTAVDAPLNGQATFVKMLTDAKAAHAKNRDYMGHIVRQERVNGTLQAEQTGELRVRNEPFCVSLKLIAPKSLNGWDGIFVTGKFDGKMRLKPAGTANFTIVPLDSPKVAAYSLHSLADTGLLAVLNRTERIVEIEKKANNPTQIVAADYTFQDRAVTRFDIYTERPHPKRFAHHTVLFVDKETHLPVRFEAYDQPRGAATTGDLIECVSFVNLKFNAGLGDSVFDR